MASKSDKTVQPRNRLCSQNTKIVHALTTLLSCQTPDATKSRSPEVRERPCPLRLSVSVNSTARANFQQQKSRYLKAYWQSLFSTICCPYRPCLPRCVQSATLTRVCGCLEPLRFVNVLTRKPRLSDATRLSRRHDPYSLHIP